MTRKVMIVVHGMGDPQRNSALLGLVHPILELIRLRGDPKKLKPLGGDLSDTSPASVDVTYGDQEWRFVEYWWGHVFRPPGTLQTARWIAVRLVHHLYSMLHHLRSLGVGLLLSFADFRPGDEPYDPLIARIYKAVAVPVYSVGVFLLLTPVLAMLLILLTLIRWIPGIPSVVGQIQSVLQLIGVDLLGDIFLYFEDEVQGSQICGGLQNLIKEFASDKEVCEVFLFSHSTGAVVVYEAIAKLHEAKSSSLDKVKASIAVGAILNMAWNPKIVKHPRFCKPIPDHIRWYDLWTQYDPGPAGPISKDGRGWLSTLKLISRRVNNNEDLILDHTGYWNNAEQVNSLALEEIGGLDDNNDFWRGKGHKGHPGGRSEQAWKDFDTRRGTIAWLAIWRLPVWFILPTMFPLMLVKFGWAQGVAQFFKLDQLPSSLSPVSTWVAISIVNSDPWVFSRIAVALLSAVLLSVAAAILYYVYKYGWWQHWAKDVRYRRHEAFKEWRDNRQASLQSDEANTK